MPRLAIKGLPAELHWKLKERAARHHRSMNEEVLAIIEWALSEEPAPRKAPPPFKGRFALTDDFLNRVRRQERGE